MWRMRYIAGRYDTPVTYALLVVMAAVFVIDFFLQGSLTGLLGWSPTIAWLHSGQFWRPFTFQFVHGGGNGILWALFDGLLIWWCGSTLERAWGAGKYLFFFFSSGILPGLVLLPQTLATNIEPIFIGMTGSFVAFVVAFAAMSPYATIYFFGVVPMQARVLAAIIIAFDLFGNYERYGGPLQALIALAVVIVYAYFFTTRRVSLPSFGGGSGPRGPSFKERLDRWQQRRKMRQWQKRVSKIDRPEDLFKDK